jgi:hypothetical protein
MIGVRDTLRHHGYGPRPPHRRTTAQLYPEGGRTMVAGALRYFVERAQEMAWSRPKAQGSATPGSSTPLIRPVNCLGWFFAMSMFRLRSWCAYG